MPRSNLLHVLPSCPRRLLRLPQAANYLMVPGMCDHLLDTLATTVAAHTPSEALAYLGHPDIQTPEELLALVAAHEVRATVDGVPSHFPYLVCIVRVLSARMPRDRSIEVYRLS